MRSLTWTEWCAAVVQDHRMARSLAGGPLRTLAQEQQMRRVRRAALFADNPPRELLAHLAIQGFLNEYAWREDAAETARVEALRGARDATSILKLACYRSLGDMTGAERLVGADMPDAVASVVRVQVADGVAERGFAEAVPSLAVVGDPASPTEPGAPDSYPYPRWSELAEAAPARLAEKLSAALPGVAVEGLPERPEILVVGCGTGQGAVETARRAAGGAVLAVDPSRARLGYAVRKARELRLDNIAFALGGIRELAASQRTFNVVEAAGDPAADLAALAALVRPGGLLRVGIRSAAAVALLAPARALGARYPHSAEGVRLFRARIAAAPPGDPLRVALEFGDFYATSACRDLLLRDAPRSHTIPQVRDLARRAGFNVLDLEPPPGLRARFQVMLPGEGREPGLDRWAAFETAQPQAFSDGYRLWLRRPA